MEYGSLEMSCCGYSMSDGELDGRGIDKDGGLEMESAGEEGEGAEEGEERTGEVPSGVKGEEVISSFVVWPLLFLAEGSVNFIRNLRFCSGVVGVARVVGGDARGVGEGVWGGGGGGNNNFCVGSASPFCNLYKFR